jgi:hypothetical protein
MFPPCLGNVFFKATFLAQRSGASEISIDILLAALAPEVDALSLLSPPADDAFFANSDWAPVSTEVAKALAPFAEMETVDPATLRRALLDAKEK